MEPWRSSLSRDELWSERNESGHLALCLDHSSGSSTETAQELEASTRCRLWGIEETAQLDEPHTPIPLRRLASSQIRGSG